MKDLVWDKTLSVDVPEIDEDHRRLVDLFNILNRSVKQGDPSDYIEAVMDELIASAQALQQKLLHEGRTVVGEDLQFLEHWLTGHILGTDKDLGAYLCERM
jgi:hemerythrin